MFIVVGDMGRSYQSRYLYAYVSWYTKAYTQRRYVDLGIADAKVKSDDTRNSRICEPERGPPGHLQDYA